MLHFMKFLTGAHMLMEGDGGGDGGSGGGGGDGGTPPSFQSLIPSGFADKGWLQGVDSMDSLFSKMDGAQNKIGQRTWIPEADASPDHVNEFYKKLAPEKNESYVFGDVEEMPEQFRRSEEDNAAIRKIFHDAGLSVHQAKLVQVGYDKHLAGALKARTEGNQEKANQEFDTLTNEIFGDKKEQALTNSKALMDKFLPEKMRPDLEKLDNKSLTILASVLNGVHQEYLAQDGGHGGGGGSGGDGFTVETANARITAIRNELGKHASDAMHPQYKDLQAELQKLYKFKIESEKKSS